MGNSRNRLFRRIAPLALLTGWMALSLPAAQAAESGHLFTSLGLKNLTWFSDSEEVEYDAATHRVVDLTLAAGDNFFVGATLDLDDKMDDYRQFAVRAGFGDLGMTVQRGKITGTIEETGGKDDDDLDYETRAGDFEEDFQLYAVYWADNWVARHSGIGYVKWTTPVRMEVNYEDENPFVSLDQSVEYIDPAAEYEIFGFYSRYDPLEAVMEGHLDSGFLGLEDIGTNGVAGVGRITPTDDIYTRQITEDTGLEPDSEPLYGFGVFGSFRWGYYAGNRLDEAPMGIAYGFAVGLEVSTATIITVENAEFVLSGGEPNYYQRQPDGLQQGSYGPFVRGAVLW
ncbi:hypothetical protein [Thiohalorhabdus methylotrophus]|uniref:Porin n=1 Tax=Thiohalorhabdus methylotrophus TaxID=3242694 RepID=A0ABV4TWD5_9GAMM